MADPTYMMRVDSEVALPTNEVVLTTAPYIEQAAVLGIMNNYGSDSIVRIQEIHCNEVIARTTTALLNINLYRITAVVGGEAVTPTKYDSTASSLPSQVSVVKYPNSVTTTGDYLRRLLTMTGLSATTALLWHGGVRGRSWRSGGINFNHYYTNEDSDIQTLVLREGQGIVFRTTLTSPQNYPVELIIHFTDGTNTFCVSEVLNIQSVTELFALLNGSGSGVVLYISRIEMRQIRTADLRMFTVEACSGIVGGTSITPMSLDSSNDAIDSQVDFRYNCIVRQGNMNSNFGRNARAGGDVIPWKRLAMTPFGKGVALASGALQLRRQVDKWHRVDAVNTVGQIVLREGEGLAILQRYNFSGWGRYEFMALFTVEDNGGAVSGGESSYVF